MGRFILLMVGATFLVASYLLLNGKQTAIDTQAEQSDYQYQSIAREAMQSGFDRGVSAIKRDLMDVATSFPRATMDDGSYDLQITKNFYGDLSVIASANSGEAAYEMTGHIVFTSPLPSALMLEDDVIAVDASGNYQISGVDRRLASQSDDGGFSDPVRGIITTENHANAILSAIQVDKVVGIGSSPDDPVNHSSVVGGYSEDEIEALYQDAKLNATSVLSAGPSGDVAESGIVAALSGSSPGNPKVIRAMGNVTITSVLEGYGMLIVEDGDLTVTAPSFDWEGLIMMRKHLKDTVAVNLQNTNVIGGFIAYDYEAAPELGLCVPDFTIDGDEAVVNDPFALRIEVLGAAITASGTYDVPVTARINVGGTAYEPWGDYDLALDGNVNTGNSGVTYLWEPTQIFESGSAISMDARSWLRSGGTDGTEESHWSVFMEEHSSTAGPQIHLLKDDDAVPNVGGFMGQYSVEEFLDGYIVNDQLVLEANQGVSLFELGATDTGSEAFDLQDLVVVITMIDASQSGCVPGGGVSRLEVDINDNTVIRYSGEAIAKLGALLETIEGNMSVVVTRSSVTGYGEGETLVLDDTVLGDDQEDEDEVIEPGEEPGEEPGNDRVTICHKPNKNGGKTKSVKQKKLAKHMAHDDYMGVCNGWVPGDDDN